MNPRHPARWLVPAAPLLMAQHCGPTAGEVGGGVLTAAPVVFVLTAGFLLLLVRLWRPLERLAVPWRAWGIHLAVLLPLAVTAMVLPTSEPWELVGAAIVAFGTSYLAVTLLVWRGWLRWGADHSMAASAAPLTASIIFLPPALLLALGTVDGRDAVNAAVAFYVFPGYAGAVPGVLLLLLLTEVLWRRRRLNAAASTHP